MKINRFTEFSCSIKKIGCCFLLGLVTQSVQSANIMVTATPSGGGCTLNSAILSANADIGISGCTAGDGDDIILIPASLGPHIYTSSLGGSDNALHDITTNIFIRGTGDQVELRRSGSDQARFFEINSTGVLTLENLRLNNGSVANRGGAIKVNPSGILFLFDSVLENNSAPGFSGGAIRSDDASVIISGSILRGNTANSEGAIDIRGGSLSINETAIEGNSTTSTISSGTGGIGARNTQVTITDSRIVDNTGLLTAGGLSLSDSNAVIRRSLFANNQVNETSSFNPGSGGAITINGGIGLTDTQRVDFYDTTISDNRARIGAGIQIFLRENRYVNFYNSTVSFNQGLSGTDAISEGVSIQGSVDLSTPSSGVNFINTVVSGNGMNSLSGREIDASLGDNYEVTFTNSLIGHSGITLAQAINSNTGTGGVAVPSPQASNVRAYSDGFEATPLNQILSRTRSEFAHELVSGSPAIDRATEGFFQSSLFTFWIPGCRGEEVEIRADRPPFRVDQRQNLRPVGARCDIGAVEYSDDSSCFVVVAENGGVVNFCL